MRSSMLVVMGSIAAVGTGLRRLTDLNAPKAATPIAPQLSQPPQIRGRERMRLGARPERAQIPNRGIPHPRRLRIDQFGVSPLPTGLHSSAGRQYAFPAARLQPIHSSDPERRNHSGKVPRPWRRRCQPRRCCHHRIRPGNTPVRRPTSCTQPKPALRQPPRHRATIATQPRRFPLATPFPTATTTPRLAKTARVFIAIPTLIVR